MGWLKKNGVTLILLLVLLLGLGIIAYPSFADWWNSFHQSRAVASYAQEVSNIDPEEFKKSLASARAYNSKLSITGINWNLSEEEQLEYEQQLSVGTTGIMGYINIPKINVMLPIYHGIDESILQVAIGHIPGSSLPVGGAGSHCIISGHRGLPSAKLFTDIDKMVEGDTFTISVLNQTLTYQVDQITVVLPTDLTQLMIEPGKDYVTLVTCTPYGINTHRLLVRGHRVRNADGDAEVIADALQIEPIYIAPFVAAPMILLLVIGVFVMTGLRTRRNQRSERIMRRKINETVNRKKEEQ